MNEFNMVQFGEKLRERIINAFYEYEDDSADLTEQVREAKEELDSARKNFDYATDETLVDLYIYQLKVAETKYKHILNLAKGQQKMVQ